MRAYDAPGGLMGLMDLGVSKVEALGLWGFGPLNPKP